MASTDYPFSVSSKFIDDHGTEHLVTIRGQNIETFQTRLTEAANIFPYAGFSVTEHVAMPAAPVPTPIKPVAATPSPPVVGWQRPPPNSPTNPIAAGEPAATAAANVRAASARIAPECPVHARKMLRSKFGDQDWYCSAKVEGGEYCDQRVAA